MHGLLFMTRSRHETRTSCLGMGDECWLFNRSRTYRNYLHSSTNDAPKQ